MNAAVLTALIALVSSVVGGAIVAAVNHHYSVKEDLHARRLDLSVDRLSEAYMFMLLNLTIDKDKHREYQIHLANIQLFGSPTTVSLTNNLMRRQAGEPVDVTTGALLSDILNSIRNDLGLDRIDTADLVRLNLGDEVDLLKRESSK
ncbi:hypothetical protein [Lutibaculum baratangense]|uniref:hypothetical protein n=1 Tax=Lutibaculum baratangense TaxID=1358440 RepID=UPI001267C4CF|nr:hypothetical protein [Lutibaculum baratangense]